MKTSSVLLLAIACFPLFVALDDSSVWDANEAFYVQTPREMVESGDWLVPTFNGQPRLNKPPLSYWLVAVGYQIFGVHLMVERLLLATLGAGCVISVFFLGRLLFNQEVALMGSLFFASGFRFLILSRRLLIDVLLLFCILMVVTCLISFLYRGKKSGLVWAGLFLGLGFLTKGPVVLLPLVAVVPFLWKAPFRSRLQIDKYLLFGLLSFLLVASSWFLLLLAVEGTAPLQKFFLTENVGRFLNEEFGPRRGWFYYIGVFFGDFFPWSFLFPAAAIWSFRLKDDSQLQWDSVRFLGLWAGIYFLFFTLSANKQEYYILPIYPATALWLAWYITRISEPLPWLQRFTGVLMVVASLLAGWLASLLFPQTRLLWVPPLILTASGLTLFSGQFRWAALLLSLFYSASFAIYLPPLEQYKPVRAMAETIQTRIRSEPVPTEVGYYRLTAPSLRFYLDQDILQLYQRPTAVEKLTDPSPTLLIMEREDFEDLQTELDNRLEIVEIRPKLYTTARTLLQGIQSGRSDESSNFFTRSVLLVSDRRRSR